MLLISIVEREVYILIAVDTYLEIGSGGRSNLFHHYSLCYPIVVFNSFNFHTVIWKQCRSWQCLLAIFGTSVICFPVTRIETPRAYRTRPVQWLTKVEFYTFCASWTRLSRHIILSIIFLEFPEVEPLLSDPKLTGRIIVREHFLRFRIVIRLWYLKLVLIVIVIEAMWRIVDLIRFRINTILCYTVI